MKSFLTIILTFTFFASSCQQQKSFYTTKNGAINGYDVVSYFDNKAQKGNLEFKVEWMGAYWFFSSAENLSKFKSNPEFYAPQYGGYCAYAVAQGYTAKINPEAWKIVNSKLYLNYNQKIKKDWELKQGEYIQLADHHWPKIKATSN